MCKVLILKRKKPERLARGFFFTGFKSSRLGGMNRRFWEGFVSGWRLMILGGLLRLGTVFAGTEGLDIRILEVKKYPRG